jgi:FkbM family methyltransferase
MTFVDVGANEGLYSMLAAQKVGPGGRVIAIEPSGRELVKLRRNIELNGLSTVSVRDIAVMDRSCEAVLSVADPAHGGQNTFGRMVYDGVGVVAQARVRGATLDDVLADLGVRPDFVKIDTEGSELGVLRGADTTLSVDRPVLMLELQEQSLRHCGGSVQEVCDMLRSHDYVLCGFEADGRLRRPSATGVVSSVNAVAVPGERVSEVELDQP